MITPEPDTRSDRRKALDDQLAAEPLLRPAEVAAGVPPRPIEEHRGRTGPVPSQERPMETATAEAAAAGGLRSKTVADLLPAAVERFGSAPAVLYKDDSGTWVATCPWKMALSCRTTASGLSPILSA